MATTEKNVVPYIVAMAVYAFVTLGISLFTQRFVSMRRFFIGRSLLLYYNNEFILKNMDKAKIDVNELLTQCRIAGHFDLSKLSAVFIEPNGNLSFLKVSTQDSVTPDDLKLPKKTGKNIYRCNCKRQNYEGKFKILCKRKNLAAGATAVKFRFGLPQNSVSNL